MIQSTKAPVTDPWDKWQASRGNVPSQILNDTFGAEVARPAYRLAKEDLKLALEAALLHCRTNDYPMIMAAWRATLASLEKGEEIIVS